MIAAELHQAVRIVIPSIVKHLKDVEWSFRQTTIDGLSILAAHRKRYRMSSFGVLNHNSS